MECLEDADEEVKPKIKLMRHQEQALELLSNGKILYGGVGSGKSAVAMAYYMKKEFPKNVYIITTAKKRDSLEWLTEAARYGIGPSADCSVGGVLQIDSWHNINQYTDVDDSFFVFDEQRLVGHGAWVKAFLRIVRRNRWIMLSATPGDKWLDYAPVFIANGWYRNITDFKQQHVVYAPYVKFPMVQRYIGESRLLRLRNEVLVEMPYIKHTERIINHWEVGYDHALFKKVMVERWNHVKGEPIQNVSELWYLLRMVVNSDPSRLEAIKDIAKLHPKLIVFYNFDYELEILRSLADDPAFDRQIFEWNGHRHDPLPISDTWLYLVQYAAGSEGWNCTSTDAIAYYSLSYSYKSFVQSQGRIDRLNTPFTKLYYYILQSGAYTDQQIGRSLAMKKDFNERNVLKELAA